MKESNLRPLLFGGANEEPCTFDRPVLVHYGQLYLGAVVPRSSDKDPTIAHIQSFSVSADEQVQRLRDLGLGRVVLLELVKQICGLIRTVTAITISLTHDLEGNADGMPFIPTLAGISLLESVGAECVLLKSAHGAKGAVRFSVNAFWQYNPRNIAALEAALNTEWPAFSHREAAAAGSTPSRKSILAGLLGEWFK